MKKILYAICAAALLLTVSCENLDLFPESEAALSENEVFSTYEGYHGFFLKCYLAMVCESQGSGHGGDDLSGWDAGRSTFLRALYWSQEAPSDEMYNQNLYFVVAIVTVIFAWGLAAVFYYVINSVRFSRWWHWLAVLGVACVAAPVTSFVICNNAFSAEGYNFSAQLFSFCVVDLAVEAVLFIVEMPGVSET